MDHRQYIEQYLSADIDGELSPAESQAVSSRLSSCADCRQRQADERAFKALLRQQIPILSAPPELRRKIVAALDREDAARVPPQVRRFSRLPLWLGWAGAAAAAAAIFVVVLMSSPRRHSPPSPGNPALEAAANDYLKAEHEFVPGSGLNTQTDLANALTMNFGYPFIWDFSSLGLNLAGGQIVHRPDGQLVAYSLYKGKGQSILCINLRQMDFSFPPGGHALHGVRFYRYRGLWIGVVNYGSVFCYFVTRMSPQQMLPALIHSGGLNPGSL